MGVEIERKFIVEDINVLIKVIEVEGASISEISQIYISDETRLRVEIIDDIEINHNVFYYLTVKWGSGLTRLEYEIEMSEKEGNFLLMDLQKSGKKQVDKTRYLFEYKNIVFELDVFKGENTGLSILEVELDSEDGEFNLPPGIGEEVTNDEKYYNSYLARNPYKNWSKKNE